MRFGRPRLSAGLGVVLLAFAAILCAPHVLAFPYSARFGRATVYSETPIRPDTAAVLQRSQALLERSPLYDARSRRTVFLTSGGWRWALLSLNAHDSFALSRPFSGAIVVNRSDVAKDEVHAPQAIGGERSLSGVIAHEWTHGLIRARFGPLADWRYPAWLREGYCDVVAGGGSLTDAQAADLRARGVAHPALLYFDGRRRVEAALRRNGGSVDRVFAEARSGP
jgi:hypothetical protein